MITLQSNIIALRTNIIKHKTQNNIEIYKTTLQYYKKL